MKKVWCLLILGLMCFFSTQLFAEVKIGVFDLQVVMIRSDAGQDIKKFLQQKKAYYTKEIKKREQALKKMREDIEKKSMMLSDTAKQEKEQEYQRKLRDLKLYAADSESELKDLYRQKTQKLIEEIVKVVKDYGKKHNFSLIVERQEGGVVYLSNTVDITQKILNEFNKYYHSKKTTNEN